MNNTMDAQKHWNIPQQILIVLAHPDDPEFFCGASIAKWTKAGHNVDYCLLTCGDKGTKDRSLESKELCCIRQKEQRAAGSILGVANITFLNYEDGYLIPSLELRRDITRVLRKVRPDILVTCDPRTLFFGSNRINHPDHRAAGQGVSGRFGCHAGRDFAVGFRRRRLRRNHGAGVPPGARELHGGA